MNPIYDEMIKLANEDKYLQAVKLAEKLEAQGAGFPEVLVLKGGYIQQIEEEDAPYELVDAERAYKAALELDPDFTWALVQLAWFYLNIMDDAASALPLFEKALSLRKSALNEAADGIVRCKLETTTVADVRVYLDSLAEGIIDRDLFEDIFEEGCWFG